jgi:hypothetical protein
MGDANRQKLPQTHDRRRANPAQASRANGWKKWHRLPASIYEGHRLEACATGAGVFTASFWASKTPKLKSSWTASGEAKNKSRNVSGGMIQRFDERAIELKLGDELFAHAGEKAVPRQAQLPGARLLFG